MAKLQMLFTGIVTWMPNIKHIWSIKEAGGKETNFFLDTRILDSEAKPVEDGARLVVIRQSGDKNRKVSQVAGKRVTVSFYDVHKWWRFTKEWNGSGHCMICNSRLSSYSIPICRFHYED